jgi:hypothetical protein
MSAAALNGRIISTLHQLLKKKDPFSLSHSLGRRTPCTQPALTDTFFFIRQNSPEKKSLPDIETTISVFWQI